MTAQRLEMELAVQMSKTFLILLLFATPVISLAFRLLLAVQSEVKFTALCLLVKCTRLTGSISPFSKYVNVASIVSLSIYQ
jgi:hypothetical protein